MQKYLFTSIAFILSLSLKGQILSDPLTGKPYYHINYKETRGSAYLFEDWKPSSVTDNKGIIFTNVMIRFDAFANDFHYNIGDTTYSFVTSIREVKLFPFSGDTVTKMIFKKGFMVSGKLTPEKYVQVLTEGKVTAIKYIYKALEEITEYNMPGAIKNFTSRITYFFIKEGAVLIQKPNARLLEELLKDKWTVIDFYMKQNFLSPKNEDDCVKIINYYNTL